jgi:tetratricopeptide (TPR) repeat protein
MRGAALLCLILLANSDARRQGLDLYNQHKYAQAIPALEEAARAETPGSPDYRETVLMIGQSYFMLAQAPKAIPWLEKAGDVNEANYMLGYAYLQNGQPEQSEVAFAHLFGLKPESAAGHLVAAQMLLKKEYEPEAAKQAKAALALDPRLPGAHFLLAEIELARGEIAPAITDLQRELDLNPSFSMGWYRLGDAYARQEKWSDAIAVLQRAIWLNPDFSGPFILLGKCYFKEKNFVNAEGILRRALAIDPRNTSATYLLGQTLLAAGKTDEGRQVLERWRSLSESENKSLE